MPSGLTPLRRNSTYGLRVAKSASSLMSFCSHSYFPANDCCFACVSFHIPVLPFLPALPSFPRTFRFVPHFSSQNPAEHVRSRSLLQHTFFYIPIPFPSMYFLFLLYFLIPYFPPFRYFLCLSRASPPKIPLSMPAPGLSSSVLPFPSVLPCVVDFTLTC